MSNRCFGQSSGIPMGKTFFTTAILRIGYDNLQQNQNVQDNSGIRIYYTEQRRKVHIGKIVAEQLEIVVPPQSPRTSISGRLLSSDNCGQQLLTGSDTFTIMSASAFMGPYGKRITLRVVKPDGSTGVIIDAVFEQSGSNTVTWTLADGIKFTPDDQFSIECTYDTSTVSDWISSSLWFTIDYIDWFYYTRNNAGETCTVELEVVPRPNQKSFLQIGNYGLLDTCQIRSGREKYIEDQTQLCDWSLLNAKIVTMNADTTKVADACSDVTKVEQCCSFLSKYEFTKFPCILTQTEFIIRKVVNSTDAPTNNRIFQTILQCIGRSVSSPQSGSTGDNSGARLNSHIPFIFLFLRMYLVFHFVTGS